jgi:hypothetical protein
MDTNTLLILGGIAAVYFLTKKKPAQVGDTVKTSAGSVYQITSKTDSAITVQKLGGGPGSSQMVFGI